MGIAHWRYILNILYLLLRKEPLELAFSVYGLWDRFGRMMSHLLWAFDISYSPCFKEAGSFQMLDYRLYFSESLLGRAGTVSSRLEMEL
jgi:hypothetical protein